MSRIVEITILSAEDLRINGKPLKKKALVSVGGTETKMSTEGGSWPSWKEKLVVEVPLHASFIVAEVKCRSLTGMKSIGMARVPVSDFVGGYVPENEVHFLSYRMWDSRVRRNGILNISVRVKAVPPVKGMPICIGSNALTGVATGIPVCYN
ncbi:BON1-associated protein 2-like [Neltuma alba]|uniref:BON1-associated protein 2-like n=1 Tax=Neltuma alba TaxID=207710 RepID=UPI0010A46630|nr:BON1-associated protein 2-like [Prosopis alba]XP_028784284.1 BON1-associated protein 2-like [Prosopis alba]